MPLRIFLLEHIVIYIEWRKDREFYCQRQGLPTGGSFSDAIAILCMWLCEKELLKSFGALVLCIRGNGIIHRAQKAIQGDDCRPRRRSWLRVSPGFLLSGTRLSYGASAVARTSDRGHVAEV